MIAADLVEAAAALPERQSEVGRVNRYVAYAYAAKVKLYQAYAQDEKNQQTTVDKDLMREVVDLCSKLDGKYSLLKDFQQLDMVALEKSQSSLYNTP